MTNDATFLEDLARLTQREFLARHGTPVLLFQTWHGQGRGGFDFTPTTLFRRDDSALPGRVTSAVPRVEWVRKRVGVPGSQVSVGRTRATDIWLDSPDVSIFHAYFAQTPTGYTVTDGGSRNGTLVGNVRLRANETAPVHNGDTIQFGGHQALFYLPEAFYALLRETCGDLLKGAFPAPELLHGAH